mgnify:CR=1 FL=1
MTDRSGTPQRRRSEEYSEEPDPEAFAKGHAQTVTEIHVPPGNFASESFPHMSTFIQAAPYVPKNKTCLPAGRSGSLVLVTSK